MNRLAKNFLLYFCLYAAFLIPVSCLRLSQTGTLKYDSLKEQDASSKTPANILQDTPCNTKVAADPTDAGVLKEFFMITGGSNWINQQGWLKGDPCKDQWFGVCCNDNGKVSELNLPNNRLVGEFPTFISVFTGLTALRLPVNYIEGIIPLDLFLIKSLEIIDLGHNQLEGGIPSKLEMPELRNLTLSKNKLGGLLPTQWSVPKLEVLSLASNMFEGSLPSSLGVLAKLQVLDLSANSLSGSLPTEYGSLVSLKKLWLFENQFDSPEIPPSWLDMRSVRNFQMNSLNGQIPKSLGSKWVDLEVLILVNGNLVGSIPTSLCNLKKLQYLHIFYNNISGSIPDCLCTTKDSALISIDLSNNLLTGSIPDCIGNLKNLHYIYLSNNGLSGSLPDSLGELGTLYSLDVNTNRLSGSIPSSLASLRGSLNQFDLSTNYLSSIENGLEPLFDEMSRKSCNVYGNPFSCPIPTYISSCGSPRCSTCNTGRNHTSCSICVKTEFCGWCDETPNCLSGYSDGPYYPYKCTTTDWHYGKDPKCL